MKPFIKKLALMMLVSVLACGGVIVAPREASAATTYTIVYNSNGGSGSMANTTVTYGVPTTLRTNTFTHAAPNTLFAGWYAKRASDGKWLYKNTTTDGWYLEGSQPSGWVKGLYPNGASVSQTSPVNGDVVTFYAQWAPNKYTIVYNANGGGGSMSSSTVYYGVSTLLRPNAFTHSSPRSTFAGWYAKRASDGKWLYKSGSTDGWYSEGSQPAGWQKAVYANCVSVAKSTTVNNDTVTMYAQWAGDVPFPGAYANDAHHTYSIAAGVSTAHQNAFIAAMNNLAATTKLTTGPAASGVADVNLQSGAYSNAPYSGYYAWTECHTYKTQYSVCNTWVVTRNTKLSHSNEQAVFCHEIGHTVGLAHAPEGDENNYYPTSGQTCMRGNPDVTKYAAGDISRINARY